MSFPDPIFRKKKRQEKPNLHADTIMKSTILTVLTTSKGWIIRQALKAIAGVTAPLTVFLADHGASDYTAAIVTGITAVTAAAIEITLSYLARKNP
jgi:hypothetical protein